MPLRKDIHKVMVLGSGPIVIGQAAEFDYAGTQACRALREEGLEVVLVNSNPATIMTDKAMADKVYIEPMTVEAVQEIIKKERPDSLLPNLGGQTGLNLAMELCESGFLDKMNVKLLGAKPDTIAKAEDRQLFKDTMEKIGEPCIASKVVHTVEDAVDFTREIGLPVIIRPAYTLGGTGGGIAYSWEQLREIAASGIMYSRVDEILVEKCISGWKEIEYEVMRDAKGNASVWVIDAENKIATRKITASRSIGTSWLVESGLKAGDRVVFEGFQRTRAGATVSPKEADASKMLDKTGKSLY